MVSIELFVKHLLSYLIYFFIPYFDDIYNKILLTFLIIFLDLHRMPKDFLELVEDWKETL